MDTPVLFLVFNRPDVTARVFETIRRARPKRLFVAADGARENTPGEAELCTETRAIVAQVDWPCEVATLLRDKNLGCRRAISGAISWFFEHVEEGVILEDDCLPDASFFPYCATLLERFRDDTRVMCIAGDNTFRTWNSPGDSYSYSSIPLIWGWATWRRAWAHYDFDRFAAGDYERVVRSVSEDPRFVRKAVAALQGTAAGEIDTWDYVWMYHVLAQGGLSCVPQTNLVRNIGFGAGATHTRDDTHPRANRATGAIALPLNNPPYVCRDPQLDAAVLAELYGTAPMPPAAYMMVRKWQRLKRAMGR